MLLRTTHLKQLCKIASKTSMINTRELHPAPLRIFNFNWMKCTYYLACLISWLILTVPVSAQTDTTTTDTTTIDTITTDTTVVVPKGPWKLEGTFAFILAESTYSKWAAGGDNQITTLTIIKPLLTYDNKKWHWVTELDVRHGLQKIGSSKATKSQDVLRIETKIGRSISKRWHFSGFYSLSTQGRPAYEDGVIKSAFMSPGYTNLNFGFDFIGIKNVSIYLSPTNLRSTYVLNDSLSDRGEYGVNPGSFVKMKFGPSLLISYKGEIFKDVLADTKLGYFQDALDGLGDPVINWDAIISIKLNKYFATTFTFSVFYDEDSKSDVKDDNGAVIGQKAYVQFKQSFGFGINYKW